MPESIPASRIAALNDAFRQTLNGGRVVLTQGVSTLPEAEQNAILKAVSFFDDFNPNNDPYSEHDFGAFSHKGKGIIFKIDYYDSTLMYGSENPADPNQTTRVLTIMLAEEY